MMKKAKLWFSYSIWRQEGQDFQLHDTEEEARDSARKEFDRHYGDDGSLEGIASICWGTVAQISKRSKDFVYREDANLDADGKDKDGYQWEPDWAYVGDWKFLPPVGGESEDYNPYL